MLYTIVVRMGFGWVVQDTMYDTEGNVITSTMASLVLVLAGLQYLHEFVVL